MLINIDETKPKVLATWIMCPDGTMLPSLYNHDYRSHETIDKQQREHPEGKPMPEDLFSDEWKEWYNETDVVIKESRWSMVDGGTSEWGQRGGEYTEMSVYDTDPFEVIRRFVCRGGRGKDSKQPLTWVPLFKMSNSWIENVIDYNTNNNIKSIYQDYYWKELEYRKENNIYIDD